MQNRWLCISHSQHLTIIAPLISALVQPLENHCERAIYQNLMKNVKINNLIISLCITIYIIGGLSHQTISN